jgi:hypothetical protein
MHPIVVGVDAYPWLEIGIEYLGGEVVRFDTF